MLVQHQEDFDLVHVHGTFSTITLLAAADAARALRKPIVVKIANDPGRVLNQLEQEPEALGVLYSSSAVVTLTPAMTEWLKSKLPEEVIHEIPNAVVLPPRVDRHGEDVLFVGRLTFQKGVDNLLRAWARVRAQRSGAMLIIAGDGPDRRSLEKLSGALGVADAVRFLGFRSDVADLYRRARVFVLSSRWEGMPNALLEAMSYGVPCIATKVDGSRHIVKHGESGLLVEADDPGELAERILEVLASEELASRLGTSARNYVEQFHAPSVIAGRYRRLYTQTIKEAR